MPEFDFIVGGIEDGIVALLRLLYGARDDNPGGYLKEIATYGGELDEKQLKQAVDQLSPMFPLMLVAYGDGVDKQMPPTSSAMGEPRVWQHDCTFTVMAVTDNARGEAEQRRGSVGDAGVYRMLADIRSALAGVKFLSRVAGDSEQIVVMVPNKQLAAGDVLLNLEPLRPSGVEYIARLTGLTAYAQHFDTYFKWTEPDRRAPGSQVEELILDVTSLNQATEPGGKPGVKLE